MNVSSTRMIREARQMSRENHAQTLKEWLKPQSYTDRIGLINSGFDKWGKHRISPQNNTQPDSGKTWCNASRHCHPAFDFSHLATVILNKQDTGWNRKHSV